MFTVLFLLFTKAFPEEANWCLKWTRVQLSFSVNRHFEIITLEGGFQLCCFINWSVFPLLISRLPQNWQLRIYNNTCNTDCIKLITYERRENRYRVCWVWFCGLSLVFSSYRRSCLLVPETAGHLLTSTTGVVTALSTTTLLLSLDNLKLRSFECRCWRCNVHRAMDFKANPKVNTAAWNLVFFFSVSFYLSFNATYSW